MPAEEVETWVLERIAERLLGGLVFRVADKVTLECELAALLPARPHVAQPAGDADVVRSRIEERRKKAALVLRVMEEDTAELAREELRTLNREIRELEGQLEAVSREASGTHPASEARGHAEALAGALWDFRTILKEGTPVEKKRLIRLFVGEIRVDGSKKTISAGFYEQPDVPQLFASAAVSAGSVENILPGAWRPQRDDELR